ncbi:MAG: translation initiation factor IF-2 [Cyanobacteria bacterium P01_A01_bin.3]
MTSTSPQANSTSRSTKVRIYELSRKLGRDNKDILDACEALGISAKSHSSSIGAADAEKICQYLNIDPGTVDFSNRKSRQEAGAQSDASGGLQILEVRKASPPDSPAAVQPSPPPSQTKPAAYPITPKSQAPSTPTSPKLASPPGQSKAAPPSPAVPPSKTPARPASPSARPDGVPKVSTPQANAPQLKRPASTPQQPAARKVAQSIERIDPPKAPAESKRPQQQIIQPPVAPKSVAPKPPAAKPAAPSQSPRKMVAKPIAPARRQAQQGGQPAPGAAAQAGSERPKPPAPTKKPQLVGAPTRPGVKAQIVQPKRSADSPRPVKPQAPKKDLPELVGPPTRAKAPSSGNDSISVAGEAAMSVPELAAAPKRPTSRVTTKRKQSSSREDEDLAALKQPAKKRGKRRRGVGKEEDSFETDTAMLSAAQQSELDALKPLPRPGAKPPTTGPRLTPVRSSRPKSSRPSRRRQQQSAVAAAIEAAEAEKPTLLELEGSLTVQELANKLQIAETEIIKALFLKGVMANINQTLDIPTAEMVATELGYEVQHKEAAAAATKTEMLDLSDVEHLTHRPPVVTIMGHVDHGKTTLLDSIRETKVASGEAGGITQHIGAYHVDLDVDGDEKRVVFLDTPGHEAFTAMRARGTKVTDIAILVVAADDGVRPQTLEAISHAQAAQVPIVVAINKIDKESASPDRVKQELAERGLVPEDWGGDIPMVGVSALAKQNLDELLEMLLLVAEVGELQANPDRPAKGTVIEANLDKARGPVATLLVQNGTLRVGDTLVAGSVMGRVKAMVDDRGMRVQEAGPSSAVEVLGMNDVPAAGDEFDVYTDDKQARQVAEDRAADQRQSRLQQAMASRRVSLGTLSAQAQEGELKELNLILKADVQGSVEAILGSLQQLSQDEVQIRVLLASPGEVSETDIDLAAASNAIIIGFNTTLAPGARAAADRYGVDIREYDIIYNLLEEITAAMEGLLEPEEVEEWLGQVEVRMLIQIGKGVVAGSYVQSGKVQRNAFVRVMRGGDRVYEGRIDSLKRFKEDVREVASGFECGISLDNFNGWQEGDVLEVYQLVAKRRTLASAGK